MIYFYEILILYPKTIIIVLTFSGELKVCIKELIGFLIKTKKS